MRIPSLLVIVGLFAAGVFGYQHFASAAKEEPAKGAPPSGIPIEAAQVREGKLAVALTTVGTLKANESLMLRPEIDGRIEAIHAAEGAFAKKDTVLVSLDDRILAAELKQAEAALNLARVSYSRAKLLKEKGAGTVSNYDNMAATLNVAQAQVDLAKAKLDKTRITAPFDGVMGLRHISPGDVVSAGQDIATFQSKNPMKIEFTLPENATRIVAVGQKINVQVDALAGRDFVGSIYALDPQIDASSRNITLRALIPNDDNALKPGLFAHISVITANRDKALFVPEPAIVPRGNNNFVLLVNKENKVETVPVTVGEHRNGEVEIVKGLTANDIVVTAGHLKLRDGADVVYTLAPTDGAAK
ncbi:MAG: efflux RND transporter periplasmic adaptor subunit [Alphaproteobacteria bacterium]|nr:efflux RND transporter periplasmic adaptor subunit [Alphaproteobacteria bacterium]